MNYETEDGFTKVCSINDIVANKGKRFIIKDIDIALFKNDDGVFALSNHCPHQHTAQIFDGYIEEGCVVCPIHGWMFNLKTGKTPAGGSGLISYDTKIIDNDIYVMVKEQEWKW
ncbi:MAG: Rieske (2Fe-2S) protein [Ignavibacteriaceae bacterium]|nr:Rieske (2Fe-2S) protein [Ignavibacteriaceae bacterium]